MPNIKNGRIKTKNEEINSFLKILLDKSKKIYWPWAEEQILRKARGMQSQTDKLELLEVVDGLLDLTSIEHFGEIQKNLKSIPEFPKEWKTVFGKMAPEIKTKKVKRRPIAKNCRFCGKFMELWWAEAGAVKKEFDCGGYSLVPIFYCPDCHESDDVITNPEDYEWLLYEGTIDFGETKKELDPREYFFLLLDYHRMRRRFQNRPYLAIPHLA